MKKKLIGMSLALLTLVGLAACSKADSKTKEASDWEKISAAGKIVIGIDDTFVPMGFRDEKDEIVGFDIDLAEAVTKELGVEAELQPIDWSMKETELNNGTIDLIWNGYTVTAERKEKVAFTQAYLKNEQVIVTLKKNKITNYADLTDKVIGAQEGSSGAYNIETQPEILGEKIKDGAPVLYPTFVETFMDLNNGRLDAFIIDSVFAEYYISKEEDPEKYVIIPSEFKEEDFAVGVRKSDKETLAKLNEALKSLAENGTGEKISQKWFGENRFLSE